MSNIRCSGVFISLCLFFYFCYLQSNNGLLFLKYFRANFKFDWHKYAFKSLLIALEKKTKISTLFQN